MTFSINLLHEYVILQYEIFVWYCGPGSNNKPFVNLRVRMCVCMYVTMCVLFFVPYRNLIL